MSGHSKWANIKRKKGANDKIKANVFAKMSHLITISVLEGGGIVEPENNVKLRLAIDKAKSVNMPKENIMRAIERGFGPNKMMLKEVVYEGFGPYGIFLLILSTTDSSNRTTAEIRNFLENWAIENKDSLISMAFVPSGEEVLIIGLAKNKSAPLQLFEKIRDGTMSLTKSQSFLDIGDTAASFGGVIFGNEYDNGITEMVNAVQEGEPDSRVYPLYAALLEKIRQEMAIALDKQKFCDILEGNFPIEMRQLVLSRLLLYKKTTREIIIALNSLSPEEIKHILEVVGNAYGVSHGQEDVINKLIKDLSLDQQFHQ